MKEVEKKIGKRRAAAVREFRRLVDERKYDEARKFYKTRRDEGDLVLYANVHLMELKMNGNRF